MPVMASSITKISATWKALTWRGDVGDEGKRKHIFAVTLDPRIDNPGDVRPPETTHTGEVVSYNFPEHAVRPLPCHLNS